MIVRATDASFHNAIANHPEVKPTLGYNEGPTDFTPCLDHPDDYVLLSDGIGAAAIFEWSAPYTWQSHTMFLPDSRGKEGLEAARAMCRWMFDNMGAKVLWGMTPFDNRAAQMFNRLIGAKPAGEGEDVAGKRVRFFTVEKT